ncbi:MAG: glycerol-3-phosphate acyltransferase [Clostridia bacterium]|nr:glycerol-3-phosphate acyltransferase [Clostridia bacterium]
MQYILVIILCYILGSSNMAKYIAAVKKVDLSAGGSGNPGASNAVILMGWGAGVLTALHDIGKSALAVVLARMVFPELPLIGATAGVASVMGHIFPFWMKFRGGKGFASYLGMTIALHWKFAIAVLVLVVAVTLITDYIVAATTTTIIIVPIGIGLLTQSVLIPLILLVASLVIAWKHRDNYVRMYNGTEIGFRRAGRGDYRVK